MLESNFYGNTVFNVVRYGNVVGSRGSIVPLFIDSLRKGEPMPVTQEDMTRFWLTLEDAINLVMYAAESKERACISVKKAPACSIMQLARVVAKVMGKPDHPSKKIGLRKGEKVHEVLVAENEMITATDGDGYITIRPYAPIPPEAISQGREYTSLSTTKLTNEELEKLIVKAMTMAGSKYSLERA